MIIPSILAFLVLGFAIILTFKARSESTLSLAAGTLVTLIFGVTELRDAILSPPGSLDQQLAVARSVALSGACALFTRLLSKRLSRSISGPGD